MKQSCHGDARVVVEALEPRRFLSGTGPLVHRHLIPRYHHGTIVREWRFPSHTVEPDALVGHFTGTSKQDVPAFRGPEPDPSVSLTFTKNSTGDLSGVLLLVGFTFDRIEPIVYSDGAFSVGGSGGTQLVVLRGVVNKTNASGITLTGTYFSAHAAGLFQGTFTLTEIS